MEMNFKADRPPTYEHSPPFRFVKAYEHEFKTHCKKRWIKVKLIDVLTKEFRAYSKQYYLEAIESQRLTINNKKTHPDYVMRDNDLLIHRTTRVEPPVMDLDVKVTEEDDELIAVEKPPGITIHTGGGYHYNTLLALLYFQQNRKNIYLLHRLDKCTSGIILFAKDKKTSVRFHEENSKLIMKKMYYARVEGDFDDVKHSQVDMPIVCLDYKEGVYTVFEKDKHENDPLYTKQPPKESQTSFRKIWYDKQTDSSLLECQPKSGRTHQIRVHLKYTGHPILNDTHYGGRFIGNLILKERYGKEQYEKMMKDGTVSRKELEIDKEDGDQIKKKRKLNDGTQEQQIVNQKAKQHEAALDQRQWDYKTRSMEICLHSARYKFEGKVFESSKPYWYEPRSID